MNQSTLTTEIKSKPTFVEILLLIYAAECVFGCSGHWVSFGPLSIRIALFLLCFMATLPLVWQKRRELFRNKFVFVALLFGVAVAFSAVVGYLNGNQLGFIFGDIKRFLPLALLPGVIAVFDTEAKLMRLLEVIFYASLLIAAVTVGLHFALLVISDNLCNAVNNFMNERGLGGLSILATGMHRIYFRSQIFLQFAFIYGVWKLWRADGYVTKAKRFFLYFCEGIIFFAVILSYTRGFWLGLAFSGLVVLIFEWQNRKRILGIVGITLVICIFLGGISALCYDQPKVAVEVVNRFNPDLIVLTAKNEDFSSPGAGSASAGDKIKSEKEENFTDMANEKSAQIRSDTLKALGKNIKAHPLCGSGLGKNLDGIRDDGKTEYMYLDFLMKLGSVGMTLLLLTFFIAPVKQSVLRLKRWKQPQEYGSIFVLGAYLAAGYWGIALTNAFNPFLDTPMGILTLFTLILCVAFSAEAKTECNAEK